MSTEAPPSYFGGTISIVHEQFLVKYGGAASGLLLFCLAKMTVQLYWRRVTFSTLESQALISSSLKFHFISHIYQKYMGFPSQPEHFRPHIVTSYATFHSQFIWLGHITNNKFVDANFPVRTCHFVYTTALNHHKTMEHFRTIPQNIKWVQSENRRCMCGSVQFCVCLVLF